MERPERLFRWPARKHGLRGHKTPQWSIGRRRACLKGALRQRFERSGGGRPSGCAFRCSTPRSFCEGRAPAPHCVRACREALCRRVRPAPRRRQLLPQHHIIRRQSCGSRSKNKRSKDQRQPTARGRASSGVGTPKTKSRRRAADADFERRLRAAGIDPDDEGPEDMPMQDMDAFRIRPRASHQYVPQ